MIRTRMTRFDAIMENTGSEYIYIFVGPFISAFQRPEREKVKGARDFIFIFLESPSCHRRWATGNKARDTHVPFHEFSAAFFLYIGSD